MRSFRFRLERVLKWKQQRERLAELHEKQSRMLQATANAAVAMLQERLAQVAEAMQDRIGQSVNTAAWIAHYHHSAQVGRALESAEVKARKAAEAVQQAATLRARMATEVEVLLHLRQRQWEEHRRVAARAEQERLDDLGMRRWQGTEVLTDPASGEVDVR